MLRLLALVLWVLPTLAVPYLPGTCQVGGLPSGEGIRLQMDFPEPLLNPVEGGLSVRLPGEGLMGVAGCPDLPVVNRHIRIPATKDVRVEVREARWTSLGAQSVAPLQERLHTEADLPLPWLRDEQVYQDAQFWPAEWLRLSEPMLMRETRLVTLSLTPFRWNPVTGELLRLEALTVLVHFNGENHVNSPLREDDEGISDDGEGMVYSARRAEAQFLRQMLGGNYIDGVHPEHNDEGEINGITWAAPALPLNYLVIAKNAAQNQAGLQNWLAWKRQKGHHVKILDENDITSWSATNIRNAIISEYNNSSYPPHYVALVGDTGGSFSIPTHSSQYDHYYAAISGGDILADVVVGRMSAETNTQLNTICNKILAYEQNPDLSNTSWLRRAGWLTGSGHCGESMSQMARDFGFQLVLERGYSQVDTAFCANSPSWVANWFNQGVSHYNYRGWVGMEGLSTSTVQAMTNAHTPISVIFTCGSGDFDGGLSYTEAFLRAGNTSQVGGAAASMGFCTLNTHTAYNNLVDGGFWCGLLDYRIPQVGTCMFRGKQELFNTLPPGDSNISNFSYWANLMGDPGMEMWCGVPDVLHFEHEPGGLGTGAQALELRVLNQNDDPMEGAAVSAWYAEEQHALGLTDTDGRVVLSLPELGQGHLMLVASRAFCKPARGSVPLDSLTAMPVLRAVTVDDENHDGVLTPGELATLGFTLANRSSSASLPELSLSMTLQDAGAAELLAASGTLPALAPQDSAAVSGELSLRVSDQWTEGLPVSLNLRLSSGLSDFIVRADLELSTPVPVISASGWLSGAPNPGQSRDFTLRVENQGNRTARQLHLDFGFPEGSGLLSTPAALDLDSLQAGENVLLTVAIRAESWLVPGYTAPLIVGWSDQSIAAAGELRAAITLGSRVAADPTGPDAYGYYAFENTDTQWTQSPAFNWIEVAPSGGGTGTVVNLHDNADEADDSRRVDLPFTFTLYGQAYTSLAVCSNGFVAFGPLAHRETDFRNHFLPCGMGPEPMLAPMWDDHKLTGDSQVATKYLPEQHVFVIEWYRMRTNSNNRINTFEIILYDPAVYLTPTGDGEIVYQYNLFDDSQSNSQDFPYCTVGLKNDDATIGLTLLNYHTRPTTATPFAAGKAVRITTSIGLTVDPPQLELSPAQLDFYLSESVAQTAADSLVLGNVGQAPLIWTASVIAPDNWPPDSLRGLAGRDQGGPDSFGYTWRDTLEPNGPPAGWVDMTNGLEVVLEDDDDFFGPIELPFAFPFYGETQQQVWVGANGFVSFQEPDGPYWQNNLTGIPNASAPDKSLMIWWDDLFPNGDFTGYTRYWTNGADSLVVAWENAPHYNQSAYGGPYTFQVVLEANGRITYNYGDMAGDDLDSDSGTIAVQWDETTGFAIRHMLIARDNISVRILPPFWLQLETAGGSVAAGETGTVLLTARNDMQGLLLPRGQYGATVRLTTNDTEHQVVDVPVTMWVGDLDLGEDAGPLSFTVGEAWPNPFNPVATLRVTLPEAARVQANLYNMKGQFVGTVLSGQRAAGTHLLRVDGSALASGVYLLQVKAGEHEAVRRLMLLK